MTELHAAWYVIHTYSGFEAKVVENIKERAAKAGCENLFTSFLVPSEHVTQVKRGVKVQTQQFVFPGYVFIQMVLTDVTWHIVKNAPRVSGFLGSRDRPIAVTEKEIARLLKQVQDGSIKPRSTAQFQVGDHLKVCDGPFNTFSGVVEEVDEAKQRLRVALSIFGRPTPVDLDFTQVEKI